MTYKMLVQRGRGGGVNWQFWFKFQNWKQMPPSSFIIHQHDKFITQKYVFVNVIYVQHFTTTTNNRHTDKYKHKSGSSVRGVRGQCVWM